MRSKSNTTIKADLLAKCVTVVARQGLAGMSLRVLGTSIDTSPRSLLYHFMSSEQLFKLIIESLVDEELADLAQTLATARSAPEGSLVISEHALKYKRRLQTYLTYTLLHREHWRHARMFEESFVHRWYLVVEHGNVFTDPNESASWAFDELVRYFGCGVLSMWNYLEETSELAPAS